MMIISLNAGCLCACDLYVCVSYFGLCVVRCLLHVSGQHRHVLWRGKKTRQEAWQSWGADYQKVENTIFWTAWLAFSSFHGMAFPSCIQDTGVKCLSVVSSLFSIKCHLCLYSCMWLRWGHEYLVSSGTSPSRRQWAWHQGSEKRGSCSICFGDSSLEAAGVIIIIFFLFSVHSLYIFFLVCLLFQFLRAARSASNYVFNPRPSHDSQRCHTGSSRQVKTSFRHFITLLLELFVTVRKKPLLGDFTLKTDFVERDL